MEIIIAFIAGAVAAGIVGFFVWRNNKKKFMSVLLNVDEIVSKYDTPEEIKAKIQEAIEVIKK